MAGRARLPDAPRARDYAAAGLQNSSQMESTMSSDPFVQFKAMQREGWGLFAPVEIATTPPAIKLVKLARVQAGQSVLDVACGTGVVAVSAARLGAQVQGLDLSPVLLEVAQRNAQVAGVSIPFTEGDVEALPYPDASFDVVLSQFGHMFAPRPALALGEMLRVLKPGGTIAFSTWPPELYVGRLFAMLSQYVPAPVGVAAPAQWGDPGFVRERLGEAVSELHFERELMMFPALSPQHHAQLMERTVGPIAKAVVSLATEPERLGELRSELLALSSAYFEDNGVRQQFLMTRARKR
jgi:SAM-dependent methyltransferase